MSASIQGFGQVAAGQVHGDGAPRTNGARGEWNGLAVKVADNPASLLADAMEEMSFAASEKVEKDVAARKKEPREKRAPQIVPPQEALADLQKRMGGRLAELLEKVKAAGGDPARFREALDAFPDPTERHAALVWLEGECAGDPGLAELAARAREALEDGEAAAIQAGYNIGGVDARAVGGAGEGRAAYRRALLGHAEIGNMLDDILQKHGDADFSGAVDFLRRAVAEDLSATHPSTDKRELESLNNDLYHLRALANFTRDFGEALERLRGEGGKAPLPRAAIDTLRHLCKAKEARLPSLDALKAALALEGGKDPTYDVRALSLSLKLAHDMPAKLFSGQEARQRMLDAGQKLLDAAIDLEEAMAPEEED